MLVAIASLVAVSMWPRSIAFADDEQPWSLRHTTDYRRETNGYWSEGEPRFFVSAKVDLGIPYTKPAFSFGYGVPHWLWAGVDVNAISTLEFVQTYAGVRAASPLLDLAFGARDTWSYGKAFVTMPPFTADDVWDAQASKARYWAWEAEAVASAPLPHSALVADFILVHTLDVPEGKFVYDESYRVVVKDPLLQGALLVHRQRQNEMDRGLSDRCQVTAFGQRMVRLIKDPPPEADLPR
jgi:hypothetical protein